MDDGRLPLYEEVAARLLFDPAAEREANMSNPHIDADWIQSADMELGADADAWIGHTRENLPVTPGPREDRSWQGL